ncbi:hypothetical protein [Mycobacterium aquaticum]|uniref:Uncharacterized protein n=1 Tax=Mycobacterium aquaticum TaxID=1927124 RepID=A0A1W9ZWW0_9MYCO|nr:hypothetical protein [Mycobacterium aquaticum]ORA21976.1 hypothetical protein BST13_36815 [Mycobacterium aquaticum]
MSQIGDVAARLDQGQAFVEDFAEFVWACELLGYRHPDLTTHMGQVRDWYAGEDGLDLRVLDADGAGLAAAAGSAERALRLQDDQLSALAQAWQGRGAQAARDFLGRHGGTAQQAVAAVRRAADTVAWLRDQLWRAVDGKVAVTERIAERCATQREAWLAAARTVRTGLGDRDTASELIDAQVRPFVDNDIGVEWVSAMRSAHTAVSDAYASAITALTDTPVPVFEIPGDLGPSWTPRPPSAVPADPPVGSTGTILAGFVPSGHAEQMPWAAPVSAPFIEPQSASPAPYLPPPGAEPAAAATSPAAFDAAALDPAAAWGGPSGGGLPGAGLTGLGSGLSGIGQQLADLFGGLIGSSADGASGPATDTALSDELDNPDASDVVDHEDASDDPDEEDPGGAADDSEADDDDADADADDAETEAESETPEEDAAAVPDDTATEAAGTVDPAEPAEPVAPQTPAPTVAPPAVPVSPAEPVAAPAGKTPCEIAADELPQVGG